MRWIAILITVSAVCFANDDWQKRKEFFRENGYLWIKNFFSEDQTMLLKAWADRINGDAQGLLEVMHQNGWTQAEFLKNVPGALIVVPEAKDPNLVCRTEDMLTCYPDLYHLVAGTVTAYIGHLLGEPYVLFKDKLNFKWPGGGAFSPHQDFPAFEFLGPREHITAMVCIDEATLENGCLQVASHWKDTFAGDPQLDADQLQAGLVVLPYVQGGKNHGSIQPAYVEKIDWVPLKTAPGDLVIFDSFLPHYSEPNLSTSSRRAMFFTHNRLREGEHRGAYYHTKRYDPENPMFHFGTPTKARDK